MPDEPQRNMLKCACGEYYVGAYPVVCRGTEHNHAGCGPLLKGQGRKDDRGKREWHLLPWQAVGYVVDVLTYGAKKYEPDNWKKVPNARQRYFDATIRHLARWRVGEARDPESGLHHLAHAACSVLFLLALDTGSDKDASTSQGKDP